MDELLHLTRLLEPQLAGSEPVTREQVEKWREHYPYFSLPLLLYLKQNQVCDAGLCARATALMGDLERLASLTGRTGDFTSFYPPEKESCAETTDDAINLFLKTYGKDCDSEDEIVLPGEAGAVYGAEMAEERPHAGHTALSEREDTADTSCFAAIPAYDYTSMLEAMPDAADAPPMQDDELLSRFIEADESGERMFLKTPADGRQALAALPEVAKETDSEPLFTESLAKIYIRQRKYAKALEIIRKLSLNNPEKNIYFADQIRFLEKLIINIKN